MSQMWRRSVRAVVTTAVTTVGVSAVLAAGAGAAWASAGVPSAGTWRQAIEAPGLAHLNVGGDALMQSLACASPGNCTAGGFYTNHLKQRRAFVISENAGRWGKALSVPGTAAGVSQISSVSCPTSGNCAADGFFTDSSGHDQVFVVNEHAGRWGKVQEVPGLAVLGHEAQIGPISCPSPGNCATAGTFRTAGTRSQAFAVSESGGRWGEAVWLS